MGMTEYGQNLALDCVLGNNTIPATLYLALTTAPPDDSDTGDLLDEPLDSAYARQAISTGAAWSEAESGISILSAAVDFPVATESWIRIKYWALCTAATSGEVIMWAPFDIAYTIPAGQMLTIPAESIGISLSGTTSSVVT